MALPITEATATTVNAETDVGVDAPDLQIFVFGLFFIFGGITSLNDVIIPKLKELFTLGYAEALLVQSAFFAAYFFVSIPAAAIVRRAGYMRTAALGLLTMTAGCLLFIPASQSGTFGVFLMALFVLAAGITTVQVVANPLISMLGKPATAPSRLTFAQAFNSLGTTIFPYVGSILILGTLATVDVTTLSGAALDAYRTAETQIVVQTYLGLAAALHRCLCVARRFAGQGACRRLGGGDRAVARFGEHQRPRCRLVATRDRAVQRDHVSDDLHARERRPRSPHRRRVGPAVRGDRRRRDRPATDGLCRR